jgi:hypothetical protein
MPEYVISGEDLDGAMAFTAQAMGGLIAVGLELGLAPEPGEEPGAFADRCRAEVRKLKGRAGA